MTGITVGMPACNNARTIARAIASVRAQTFREWALVVSDDASTDATDTVARNAAGDDPRIRVVRQPVRLGTANFRAVLEAARTPLFIWLAADDWWEPGVLGALHDTLAARPDAVSAVPRVAWAGPAPDAVPTGQPPVTGPLDGPRADRVRAFLADPGGSRIYGLMRTDAARAAFPPRDMHAWDWAMVLGLLAQGPQVEVPPSRMDATLLREETDWLTYPEDADATGRGVLVRAFPAYAASRTAVMRGDIPVRALPALVALNLRKHEEYVAVCHPATFARRLWMYRRLGLPFASDPRSAAWLMGRVAARNATRNPARAEAARALRQRLAAPRPAPAAPALRKRGALPPLTAVMAVRNAEATLDRALAHLMRHDARVIVIDHGSTDRSRAIAEARMGAPVDRIIKHPFDGVFDLAAILDLKASVIAGVRHGWVIHADADEFLDPPPGWTGPAPDGGATLRALAAGWSDAVLAASCDELAFFPRTEDEVHHPATFEATLTHAAPIRDHDPKQRLFRAGADLTLWRATGGHSVTGDAARLAPDRLLLRHYPGLSLDHLRAQYLSRVFAPAALARRWHMTRAAARRFDIVPPPEGTLAPLGAPVPPARATLPVFAPHAADPAPDTPAVPVDLWIVCRDRVAAEPAVALIAAQFPGLRIAVVPVVPAAPAAVLQVLTHPATAAGRAAASDWLRTIARARQDALAPGMRYAEVRVEDLPDRAGPLVVAVRRLLLGPSPPALSQPPGAPVARPCPDPATRAICTDMARDLGYAWTDA